MHHMSPLDSPSEPASIRLHRALRAIMAPWLSKHLPFAQMQTRMRLLIVCCGRAIGSNQTVATGGRPDVLAQALHLLAVRVPRVLHGGGRAADTDGPELMSELQPLDPLAALQTTVPRAVGHAGVDELHDAVSHLLRKPFVLQQARA